MNSTYTPVMLVPEPSVTVNDTYLDGSIAYSTYTKLIQSEILEQETFWGPVPHFWSFYRFIALELVTETVFNYPYPYISEKTLKPILNGRMFVIAGAKGILELLQSKGFVTWDDIIDESYDKIVDPTQRLKAICESLKKFYELDINDIKEYMNKNKDKFLHNANHLQILKNHELDQLRQKIKKSKL